MPQHRILLAAAGLAVFCGASAAQQPCAAIKIRSNVEVAGAGLSLADLLAPDACPEVRRRAAGIRLGGAPLPGSERVLAGDHVRGLIEQLIEQLPGLTPLGMAGGAPARATTEGGVPVPERITVRRAGAGMSCTEIAQAFSLNLRSPGIDREAARSEVMDSPARFLAPRLDCTGAGRIPRGASLELTRRFWDAASRNWAYTLRCVGPKSCVPFLVRARGKAPAPRADPDIASGPAGSLRALPLSSSSPLLPKLFRTGIAPQAGQQPLLVRPGETVTLTWEEAGIRLVLPVTCLDRGALGESVRARMKTGGRVLWAEVVGEGKLRAAL